MESVGYSAVMWRKQTEPGASATGDLNAPVADAPGSVCCGREILNSENDTFINSIFCHVVTYEPIKSIFST